MVAPKKQDTDAIKKLMPRTTYITSRSRPAHDVHRRRPYYRQQHRLGSSLEVVRHHRPIFMADNYGASSITTYFLSPDTSCH